MALAFDSLVDTYISESRFIRHLQGLQVLRVIRGVQVTVYPVSRQYVVPSFGRTAGKPSYSDVGGRLVFCA